MLPLFVGLVTAGSGKQLPQNVQLASPAFHLCPHVHPLQVLVLADSKEAATVVPRWHSTPSGVLIITHDMFSILGTLLDTALCGAVHSFVMERQPGLPVRSQPAKLGCSQVEDLHPPLMPPLG